MANETSGNTGEICLQSGVYNCSVHPAQEVPIAKESQFPECKMQDGHSTTWILVRKPGEKMIARLLDSLGKKG